jgi:hypothetical protein
VVIEGYKVKLKLKFKRKEKEKKRKEKKTKKKRFWPKLGRNFTYSDKEHYEGHTALFLSGKNYKKY